MDYPEPYISPETGLPVLPDGLIWRVRDNYNSYWLDIVQLTETVIEAHQKRVWLFDLIPLGWKDVPERHESGFSTLYAWELVVVDPSYTTGRRKPDLRDVTPALILETALKVLRAKWDAEQAQKLMGDYPPNSIVTTK